MEPSIYPVYVRRSRTYFVVRTMVRALFWVLLIGTAAAIIYLLTPRVIPCTPGAHREGIDSICRQDAP